MPAYKDKKTGKWYLFFYHTDWKGIKKGKTKRGFSTKKEALAWETNFKMNESVNLDMNFEDFVKIYHDYIKIRIKYNTWLTKEGITKNKILSYFKNLSMNKITVATVIEWQNEMLKYTDEKGKPYSPVYLKTIHNQLSAIFNHAVEFYNLKENPAKKAHNMGKDYGKPLDFWVKEEYLKFSEAIMDKPVSFYAFEILYWCGLRIGELFALTKGDIDFKNQKITIDKSYQKLEGKDYITPPKTKSSNRVVQMPEFVADELEEYINSLYKIKNDERIFDISKNYMHNEMTRGSKKAGVKRIRVHDLRHPCVKSELKKYIKF